MCVIRRTSGSADHSAYSPPRSGPCPALGCGCPALFAQEAAWAERGAKSWNPPSLSPAQGPVSFPRGRQGANFLQKSSPPSHYERQRCPVSSEVFHFCGNTHPAILTLCRQNGKYLSVVSLALGKRDSMNMHRSLPASSLAPGEHDHDQA